MARITGHSLLHEGAPFDANGNVISSGGFIRTSGDGRAKCQCGELSDWLPSGGARRAWHRNVHKTQVAGEHGKEQQ